MKKKIVLVLLVLSTMLCLAAFGFLTWWLFGGDVVEELDAQMVPTAEHLLQNPLPTPNYIGGIALGEIAREEACVLFWPGFVDSQLGKAPAMFFVNGYRVPPNTVDFTDLYTLSFFGDVVTGAFIFCLPPSVFGEGLHLVEMRVHRSIGEMIGIGEPLSYTWAIRVSKD